LSAYCHFKEAHRIAFNPSREVTAGRADSIGFLVGEAANVSDELEAMYGAEER